MLDTKVVQVTGRGTNVNFIIDDSAPMETVAQRLCEHLREQRALYSRGTITVNVGRRILEREELTQIKEILERESGVTVSRFWCSPDILEQALSESLGLGVAVSPSDRPGREDSDRRRARESPGPSPWDDDQASALERWTAYVLEDTPPLKERPKPPASPPSETGAAEEEQPSASAQPAPDIPQEDGDHGPEAGLEHSPPEPESSLQLDPPAEEQPEEDTASASQDTRQEHPAEDAQGKQAQGRGPGGSPQTGAAAQPGKEVEQQGAPGSQVKRVRPFDPQQETVGLNRGNEALLIKTTCRSGEVIRYPGDVVVLADVNPGAEIIADGDILVFGSLRGLAHAGAGGDIQATIIALNLDTHRLQIGPYTGVAPKSSKRSKSNSSNPRIALVRRRAIYVAPYAGRFAGYSGGTLYDG